jgi:Arm DNA-binding domain
MPKLKLTETVVHEKLKAPDPSGKQVLHWDSEQTGLGVLCSGVSATKSYVVQHEVKGKSRRIKLGRVTDWSRAGRTLEDARHEAAKLVLQMKEGIDPKAQRKRDSETNKTLQQILDQYLADQELSERSKTLYRYMVEHWLDDWLDRRCARSRVRWSRPGSARSRER